jgi:hypothetical protein
MVFRARAAAAAPWAFVAVLVASIGASVSDGTPSVLFTLSVDAELDDLQIMRLHKALNNNFPSGSVKSSTDVSSQYQTSLSQLNPPPRPPPNPPPNPPSNTGPFTHYTPLTSAGMFAHVYETPVRSHTLFPVHVYADTKENMMTSWSFRLQFQGDLFQIESYKVGDAWGSPTVTNTTGYSFIMTLTGSTPSRGSAVKLAEVNFRIKDVSTGTFDFAMQGTTLFMVNDVSRTFTDNQTVQMNDGRGGAQTSVSLVVEGPCEVEGGCDVVSIVAGLGDPIVDALPSACFLFPENGFKMPYTPSNQTAWTDGEGIYVNRMFVGKTATVAHDDLVYIRACSSHLENTTEAFSLVVFDDDDVEYTYSTSITTMLQAPYPPPSPSPPPYPLPSPPPLPTLNPPPPKDGEANPFDLGANMTVSAGTCTELRSIIISGLDVAIDLRVSSYGSAFSDLNDLPIPWDYPFGQSGTGFWRPPATGRELQFTMYYTGVNNEFYYQACAGTITGATYSFWVTIQRYIPSITTDFPIVRSTTLTLTVE